MQSVYFGNTSEWDCPLYYPTERHDPLNQVSRRVSTSLFRDDQADLASAPIVVAQQALYISQVVSVQERNSPSTAAHNQLSPTLFLPGHLEDF